MAPRVVARLHRRWEGRVGERADHDDDVVGLRRLRVEDRRPAVRAEVEDVLLPVGLVRDPRVVAVATDDLHLIVSEAGLHAERASRPALAGDAMAERDPERVAVHLELKLPAVTGGVARGQGHRLFQAFFLHGHSSSSESLVRK